MLAQAGIALAVITMLLWGLGDFLIQKSARKLGDWETLFVVTGFGTLMLIPFVWRSIPAILNDRLIVFVLLGSALFLTLAAIFELESFKRGKMAVVETMVPFEIPAASILAFFILGDVISGLQFALIVSLIIGLFLVSLKGNVLTRHFLAEKGVFLGLAGATVMGVADFLLGWGSRAIDPVAANFVLNLFMALISGGYLIYRGGMRKLGKDIMGNRGLLLVMALTDNIAWVGYAFAMTVIPIAVATGLSETSCIIAVLLGIFVNKERLVTHQKVGLVVALASAIVLAFVTA